MKLINKIVLGMTEKRARLLLRVAVVLFLIALVLFGIGIYLLINQK